MGKICSSAFPEGRMSSKSSPLPLPVGASLLAIPLPLHPFLFLVIVLSIIYGCGPKESTRSRPKRRHSADH